MKTETEFEEYWKSLSKEQREKLKEIIIERIKKMSDKYKLSIG